MYSVSAAILLHEAVIQQNDYNPWGASVHGNSLISGNYPYLYGGKESLAELSYHTGPYNYCPGNPLSAASIGCSVTVWRPVNGVLRKRSGMEDRRDHSMGFKK